LEIIIVKGVQKALAGLQKFLSKGISKAYKGPFKGRLNAAKIPFEGT
jgi:hypothetical protein